MQCDWLKYSYTVEPPFKGPLYNEVLNIMNNIHQPSNGEISCIEKNLDTTRPCYSEQIVPIPWPFIKSRFHCTISKGVHIIETFSDLFEEDLEIFLDNSIFKNTKQKKQYVDCYGT